MEGHCARAARHGDTDHRPFGRLRRTLRLALPHPRTRRQRNDASVPSACEAMKSGPRLGEFRAISTNRILSFALFASPALAPGAAPETRAPEASGSEAFVSGGLGSEARVHCGL